MPDRRNNARGFTLIELLVVLLIMGIMVTGAVLATGVAHGDRDMETERDRILALASHLRDMATLQNREYGMRWYQGGYEFLVFDPREGLWLREPADPAMRPRRIPAAIEVELYVDGRRIVLPDEEQKPDELAPQVLLFSSGEMNLFEVQVRRGPGGTGFLVKPSETADRIEASELKADPA